MSKVSNKPTLSAMKYRVVNPLGTGAGSTVLLISDKTAGGKRYALKVVKRQDADDDIYIAQARVEYAAAQKLNHPAIAKVYDIRTKRSWFRLSGVELLLEYVDGKTLEEIEAPAMGQLVLIFNQVVSALTHMHRRGVYHGDLKPSNIMLSKGGQVKLIDFGTAWIKGEEKNRVQGTPQYMAPEQVNEKVVDERTDIYNLGATMYRMFTGRHVQQGIPKSGEEGARKIPSPIQINPKIPGTLNETIMACVELSPERRPAGMFEVKNQLAAVAKYMGLEEVDLRGADEEEF
jgi:serine/threonine-protein kinase